MAVAFVRGAQTGSTAAATLALPASPAKGNLLVAFLKWNKATAPKISDDVSGETGWTFVGTAGLLNGSTESVWAAYKVAVGTEKELKGVGATFGGLCYFEVSGAGETPTLDVITHKDNGAEGQLETTTPITTTDASDIVLVAVVTSTSLTGEPEWTGATGLSTEGTRCRGAWSIPAAILTEKSYTTHWGIAHPHGSLVVSFKAAATGGPVTIPLAAAASTSGASAALQAATQIPLTSAASTSAASLAVQAATVIPLSAAASSSSATAAVQAATQIPLAAAASSSSATMSLQAATTIPLTAAGSTSGAIAQLHAPTQIPLSAASSTSAASMTVTASSGATITLAAAASTSAASLAVTAPTQIPLAAGASTSGASLAAHAPTQVPLSPASSESGAAVTVTIPALVTLARAESVSGARAQVSVQSPTSYGFASLAITSPARAQLTFAIVNTAELSVAQVNRAALEVVQI